MARSCCCACRGSPACCGGSTGNPAADRLQCRLLARCSRRRGAQQVSSVNGDRRYSVALRTLEAWDQGRSVPPANSGAGPPKLSESRRVAAGPERICSVVRSVRRGIGVLVCRHLVARRVNRPRWGTAIDVGLRDTQQCSQGVLMNLWGLPGTECAVPVPRRQSDRVHRAGDAAGEEPAECGQGVRVHRPPARPRGGGAARSGTRPGDAHRCRPPLKPSAPAPYGRPLAERLQLAGTLESHTLAHVRLSRSRRHMSRLIARLVNRAQL